jgi:hypothetical protein
MAKKGVSSVSGVTNPSVGEKYTYNVVSWYPATPDSEKNPANVTWELFKKRKDGSFTSTNIKKKGTSDFTFGEAAAGETYKLQAYLYEPEDGGLIITPKPANIPKINKVELFYVDDTKGMLFSFMETLRARANCINMLGKELLFTLWEDDAKGAGHRSKNLPVATKKARVNKDGVAAVDFSLSPLMMLKASRGEQDSKLEFYVTVEYFKNKKHATENVEVRNPFPQTQTPTPKAPPVKPAPKPASAKPAAPPKAKGSPAAAKPASQKEEKGIWDSITETVTQKGGELWDWAESVGTAIKDKLPTLPSFGVKSPVVEKGNKGTAKDCGGKFCIKRGDKNELVREINIRLAGFGGNVPTDEFTERTEKMVKQFQRDYMKIPETGKVCGNVLRAIDEFQNRFTVNFTEIACKCGKCTGYGDGSHKGQYLRGSAEAHHRYEYPGVHRSLLSSLRSVKFYLAKDGRYNFNKVSSGYRCRFHPEYLKRPTTNHMGKALDLHFNNSKGRTRAVSDIETIRKDIFNKYLGAKWDWREGNIFNLESTRVGATTWVHYDVREFDTVYLEDKFFAKNINDLNGKSIVALAAELGFRETCNCLGGGAAKSQVRDKTNSNNKYRWAHSEFGNLIAQEESGNDYNICNRTKGGLQVVRDVIVVEHTISEIQQKQADRDVFAVGRYQLIPNTFNGAVTSLGLDGNTKLDEETQDQIFDEYLIKVKRPKITAYLEGDGTVEDAMYTAAQEWASIGVEKGKRISDKVVKDKNGKVISRTARYAEGGESYYAGDGLNKSHISPEQIKNALINSKNANK